MRGTWRTEQLGDLSEKIGSGATPRGGKDVYLSDGETSLIRSQNVLNFSFERGGLASISPEHAQQLSNVEVQEGDVLLNITGDSVARCWQVPPDVLPARVNQHVAIIRPMAQELDARFLRYFFVNPSMQNHMLALAGAGATRNALTKGMIENFRVPVPPLPEQRAIAHILGTLDDKIELNRRMNQTLEEIARAIFKSWFIDFDPVRAKAAGRHPEGMDAETAALFPDAFVDSELGEIPAGWRTSEFGEVATNPRRTVDPRSVPAETPYIGLEHMPKRSVALTEWGLASDVESGKHRFEQGEVLFGKLRPYFHKVGAPAVSGICSSDILVFAPNQRCLFMFVLCHASSDEYVQYADGGSQGTRMPRADWKLLSRHPLRLPSSAVMDRFDTLSRPLVERIWSNIHESRTLASLRDILLPKLLSGELRVPDAERLVEQHV